MSIQPHDDASSVDEFLSEIQGASGSEDVDIQNSINENESQSRQETYIGSTDHAPLRNIKKLRKLLAGLIQEYRSLFRNNSWSRSKRLSIALLQAKINYFKEAYIFLELKDIQALGKLGMDVLDGIRTCSQGVSTEEPIDEFLKVVSGLGSHLRQVFLLFEDAMAKLELPDTSKRMIQEQDLQADLLKMREDKESLIATLEKSCKRFHPEDWDTEMTLDPRLVAIDKLSCPDDSINKLPFDFIRQFAFRRGLLWNRFETRFQEKQNILEKLLVNFQTESSDLQNALALCREGNYRKAQLILKGTLGCFNSLPYEKVEQEVEDWKRKALQPYLKLLGLMPNLHPVGLDKVKLLVQQFDALIKENVTRQGRSIFNPIRLIWAKSKWLSKVQKYKETCSSQMDETRKLPASQFREVLLNRWEKGCVHAEVLTNQIHKVFHFHLIKNSTILTLLSVCILAGYGLYNYWKQLPETILEFHSAKIPLKSIQLQTGNNKPSIPLLNNPSGKYQLSYLTPGDYQIVAKFADAFPIRFVKKIHLGESINLTETLSSYFNSVQDTSLKIDAPTGSLVHVRQIKTGLSETFRMNARTLLGTGNGQSLVSVDFNPTGDYMVTTSLDNKAFIWEVDNGKIIGTLTTGDTPIVEATFSPSGKYILALEHGGTISICDPKSGKSLCFLNQNGAPLACLAFRPDEKSLLALDVQDRLWEWSLPKGELVGRENLFPKKELYKKWAFAVVHPSWKREIPPGLQVHLNPVTVMPAQIHAGEKTVIVARLSAKDRIKIWEGAINNLQETELETMPVNTLKIDPSGMYLVTTGLDGSIHAINRKDGEGKVLRKNSKAVIHQVIFNSTGELLLTANSSGQIDLMSFPDGKSLLNFRNRHASHGVMAMSPSGDSIIMDEQGKNLQLWKRISCQTIHTPPGQYEISIEYGAEKLLTKNVTIQSGETRQLTAVLR